MCDGIEDEFNQATYDDWCVVVLSSGSKGVDASDTKDISYFEFEAGLLDPTCSEFPENDQNNFNGCYPSTVESSSCSTSAKVHELSLVEVTDVLCAYTDAERIAVLSGFFLREANLSIQRLLACEDDDSLIRSTTVVLIEYRSAL